MDDEFHSSREELLDLLSNHVPLVEDEDKFAWMEECSKIINANSCYNYLQKISQMKELKENLEDALGDYGEKKFKLK